MSHLSVEEQRPVYRHIVAQRKALVQHVPTEDLRRLRQQMEAGVEIDEDLRHLVIHDTLHRSVRKAMKWAGHGDVKMEVSDGEGLSPGAILAEAKKMDERGDEETVLKYQRQEGVVVSHIIKDHIPGGVEGEIMPGQSTLLGHPGFDTAPDASAEYLRCADALLKQFEAHSDRQFMLMDKDLRKACTLVTLVLTPIIAVPRAEVGLELLCEFYQKTRFGYVDIDSFEVFSETGEFPIDIPNDMDLAMMFKTVDELGMAMTTR
jgi:hypothetical protein